MNDNDVVCMAGCVIKKSGYFYRLVKPNMCSASFMTAKKP